MRKLFNMSAILATAILASCASEDIYNSEDGAAYREQKTKELKEEFRASFEKTFGSISSTQSWDFAGNQVVYCPATRAITSGKEETFSQSLRTALKNVLTEGRDNHSVGQAYTLISQGPFDIYPLYHGQCMQWDLYVNDEKIGSYADIMGMMGETTAYGNGKTTALTTTGWHVDVPVGTPIFIKLVVTKNKTGYASEGQYAKNGDVITSVYTTPVPYKNGTLKYGSLVLPWEKLSVAKPANLDQVIMFEDSKTKSGDADFNDFVLGIKGREITPSPIEVTVGETSTTYDVPSSVTKRYMIEDLGSTDDFDYNDVVVDVTANTITTHTVTTITETKYQDGKVIGTQETVKDEVTETKENTSAIVRALGGTLDFDLKIGRTPWNKKQATGAPYNMWNTGYNGTTINPEATEYVIENIEGYSPEANNISIAVYQVRTNATPVDGQSPWTIEAEFPAPGATPFIIAVPTDKAWSVERTKFDFENYLQK